MNWVLPEPSVELLLGGFLLLLVLVATTMSLAASNARAWRNTPLAADLPDLESQLRQRQERLRDLDAAIQRREGELRKRDDLAAEITHLERRLEELQAEIAALPEGQEEVAALRREIGEVLEQRAQAAEALAAAKAELTQAKEQTQDLERRAEAAGVRAQALEDREAELRRLLSTLEPEADEARRLREELSLLAGQRDERRGELDRIGAELAHRKQSLESLQREIEAAKKAADELKGLANERDRLLMAIDRLRDDERELQSKVDDLRAWIAANGSAAVGSAGGDDRESLLSDLTKVPACLRSGPIGDARSPMSETEALHEVNTYLRGHGLRFEDRTVKAFHTALKIAEHSPMTVLAGISGTGKSQLPRRYAEAMGMHFLQIAVQPRWDSPQDLLGFYNYIERGYRATELAQAMVHLDGFNWEAESKPFEGRLLLVLLDEMNLARVEYYFSEFLSRLEARPPANQVHEAARRAAAEIAIDVRTAAKQEAYRVFPDYNLIFTGTMNEDESTQALSDKVLDRSNVLQFSRPKDFAEPAPTESPTVSERWLRAGSWRSWVRPGSALQGAEADKVRNVVARLSDIMSECGRGFGHRLSHAIHAYVANYPAERHRPIDDALADQIEARILPKLRGLEVEPHGEPLRKL